MTGLTMVPPTTLLTLEVLKFNKLVFRKICIYLLTFQVRIMVIMRAFVNEDVGKRATSLFVFLLRGGGKCLPWTGFLGHTIVCFLAILFVQLATVFWWHLLALLSLLALTLASTATSSSSATTVTGSLALSGDGRDVLHDGRKRHLGVGGSPDDVGQVDSPVEVLLQVHVSDGRLDVGG